MDDAQRQQLVRERNAIDEELTLLRKRRRIDEMLAGPAQMMHMPTSGSRAEPISLDDDEEETVDAKPVKQEEHECEVQPPAYAPFRAISIGLLGGLPDLPIDGGVQVRAVNTVAANTAVPVALQSTPPTPQPLPPQIQQPDKSSQPAAFREVSIIQHPKFPTLVMRGDRQGWYELRCCYCNGNWIRSKNSFFNGAAGLRCHIRVCHEEKFPNTGLTEREIVELCRMHELSDTEVEDMLKRKKKAYAIPQIRFVPMPSGSTTKHGRPRKLSEHDGESVRSASTVGTLKRSKAKSKRSAFGEAEYRPGKTDDDEDQPPRSGMSKARLENSKRRHLR